MDKSMSKSWTAWGAVIAGVGGILTLIGTSLSGEAPIAWGVILTKAVEIIGIVVAIIGGRRAVGKLITANGK